MNKKTFKPTSELPNGFADRQEEELLIRDLLISNIKKIMSKYGFQYLETPSFEYTDSIGKFLPDKDRPSEGVFSFEDEKKWLSLRYDLTAPLARYAAKNFDSLPRPFKRFQLGTVWRNEKPGPGRFREFLQFDADYIGTNNLFSDAELCFLISEILNNCGLEKSEYIIKISNRKLSKGLLEKLNITDEQKQSITLRAIDKLDRVGVEGVQYLLGKGRKDKSGDFTKGAELEETQIKEIIKFLNIKNLSDKNFERIKEIATDNKSMNDGIKELELMEKYFSLFNFTNYIFDPTVVRGLEYYTGPIFEANLTFGVKNNKGQEIEFGSVGGGGRYDDLVKRFNNQDCPSTGISVGLDRLIYAILQKNKIKAEKKNPVLICVFDEKYMDFYIKILNVLRSKNISAEIYSGSSNIKSQFKYADKRGCDFVILCGDDEVSKNVVTIKNLNVGKQMSENIKDRSEWKQSSEAQKTVAFDQLLNEIK
ncbi:MAG: histidine--tRNA ligase [Candidatus Pelagibacter sp.]|nr:histidine--tRNA ligase [Candidatus Pelagibacter sp.]